MKTKVKELNTLNAAILELFKWPLSYKSFKVLSDWQDAVEPIMNKKLEDFWFEAKLSTAKLAVENSFKNEKDNLLKDWLSTKEVDAKINNAFNEKQKELYEELNQEEVDVPVIEYEFDEKIPGIMNSYFMKSDLVNVTTPDIEWSKKK